VPRALTSLGEEKRRRLRNERLADLGFYEV
jgi:hypothetical protein